MSILNLKSSPKNRLIGRRRRLCLEALEARACPAICYWGAFGDTLIWEGTVNNDILNAIWGDPATGTIKYDTSPQTCPEFGAPGPYNTGVPIPTAAPGGQIAIRIYGGLGNDQVTFWWGPAGPPPTSNLAGFPPNSVTTVTFNGEDGYDVFSPPEGGPVAGGWQGVVVQPAAGAMPNIRFYGGLGDDLLYNNDDPEFMDGGPGLDRVELASDGTKGGGNDVLKGDFGQDIIHGGPGDDQIDGGPDRDWLYGEGDNDTISGGPGNDEIQGGTGADVIDGGLDADTISGDNGDDLIYGNGGPDTIDAGAGFDAVYGGDDNDDISGGVDPDYLDGEAGEDTVYGNGGNDEIYGGTGADMLHGGTENDYLWSQSYLISDQPYNGVGPNPTWPDMKGTGEQGCDEEDGHPDGDPGCAGSGCNGGSPLATDDWYAATPSAIGNVLDNDTDPSGVPSQAVVTVVLGPSHTTSFSLLADGSFSYTMDSAYSGQDTFKYEFRCCGQTSNVATVTLESMGMPLLLDLPPVEPSADSRSITEADLALLANEAARRWVAAGFDADAAQRALAGTKIVIDDLPGSMLGMEAPGIIVIDVNAAGYGWFIDATASLDEEFDIVVAPSEFQAGRGTKAFGYVDALSVLMHEFGHAIGMVHLEGAEFEHSVMHDTLSLSTRRIPMKTDLAATDAIYALLAESGTPVRRRYW